MTALSNSHRNYVNNLSYYLDTRLKDYYNDVIRSATGLSLDQMTTIKQWCVKNPPPNNTTSGKSTYSCSFDPRARLSDPVLYQQQFLAQRNNALDLMQKTEREYYTLGNLQTLDLETMLQRDFLFRDSSVITFPVFYDVRSNRPFQYMCDGAVNTGQSALGQIKQTIKTAIPSYYLVELTSDPKVLEQFNAMKPSGGTDSSSGLLRAVQVLAKGQNPRKVIILISDGEDNGSMAMGPMGLSDQLTASAF